MPKKAQLNSGNKEDSEHEGLVWSYLFCSVLFWPGLAWSGLVWSGLVWPD